MKRTLISGLLLFSFLMPVAAADIPNLSDLKKSSLSAENQKDDILSKTEKTSKSSLKNNSIPTPNVQIAMSAPFYPVTAGDIYSLSFYTGGNAVQYAIPVDSSYKIRVANLGIINCEGLSYLQLKSQVETLVVKNFPMSGVQFVLTSPAVFTVKLSGEVTEASECYVWALTRLSEILDDYLTDYSSKRNISIEDSNGKSKKYDLFLAKRNGDFNQDPFLRPRDNIIVGRIDRKVEISGEVERPETYEILPGENLQELIELYGNGLTTSADTSRIELTRTLNGIEGTGEKIYLKKDDITANYALKCFDAVYIASYTDTMPVVFIEGAITNPEIKTNTTNNNNNNNNPSGTTSISSRFIYGEDYAFFIRRHQNWFSSESDLEHAYIIRGQKKLSIDINKVLYDKTFYSNIQIEDKDTLIIPFRQYFVSVAGAVAHPGRFPYIPDRKWDYYIGLAGGFIESQNTGDAVTIKDINGKKYSKNQDITPETTITAKTNSGLYFFNQYAPVITTILSLISSTISILVVTGVMKK